MALQFALFLLGRSINPIPETYRREFMREVLWVISRRMRILLAVSIPSYLLLIYFVNVKNIFFLTAESNRIVLIMHGILLVATSFAMALLTLRSAKSPQTIGLYHFIVIVFVYVMWIMAAMLFLLTVIKTNGHPIFVFFAILTWSTSFLFPPRVLVFTHAVFLVSLWTMMTVFNVPTDNSRFNSEALAASLGVSAALIASGREMFKTQAETFRQRKMIEEERNHITELNRELERRQDVLEHQATEIEIINTQLQEQNQTLLELNNEKNEIMGIVAHDLKNPIGAVRGFAELVQGGYVQPEETTAIADKIVTVSNRMLELVTNLLDVNRLESGVIELSMVEMDIIPVVQSVIESYQAQAIAKTIGIHFTNEAPVSVIWADEQAIVQVLDNLISNAVKYSPHGKSVYVRVKSLQSSLSGEAPSSLALGREDSHSSFVIGHLSGGERQANTLMTNDQLTNDQWLRIEVQDEGLGISEDDMKKLFGKFARLSSRPTGGEHSTGLGLSIVKKMVEAMNGRVWCESEPGKGATFIVEMPLVE